MSPHNSTGTIYAFACSVGPELINFSWIEYPPRLLEAHECRLYGKCTERMGPSLCLTWTSIIRDFEWVIMDLGAVYLITWSWGLWVHIAEISTSVLDRGTFSQCSSDTGYHLPAECVKGSREEVLHIKHQRSSLQRQQERSQHLRPCFYQVIMFLRTWASFGVPVCLSLWPARHHLWVNGAQVYLPKQSFLS